MFIRSEAQSFADENNIPYEVSLAYFKYKNNIFTKNRNNGKLTSYDTGRQKVYEAEIMCRNKFGRTPITIEQAQKMVERVFESTTWQKFATNRASKVLPTLEYRSGLHCNSGLAYHSRIVLGFSGLSLDTLIHELVHTNGHRDHQQNFRAAHVAFAKRFIGREYGEYLLECYKTKGLKSTIYKEKKVKSFDVWYKSYARIKEARASKG